MWRVQHPHVDSGYLASVSYESILDDEGKQHWEMIYVPGPKAISEFRAFSRKTARSQATVQISLPLSDILAAPARPKSGRELGSQAERLIAELVASGVSKSWSRTHVQGLSDEGVERAEHVLDYWGSIGATKTWSNPAACFAPLLELQATEGITIPSRYPSRKQRAADRAQTKRQIE